MRVAVIGSRESRGITVDFILRHLPAECTGIISGGARGVDTLAEQAAKLRRIPVTRHLPDYEAFGKSAPLVRNIKIVKDADLVLAFWDHQSPGTAFVIKECLRQGISVRVIRI